MKRSVRVLAFGPSDNRESHVLGTTAREERAVQPNPAVAGNTSVKTLALGVVLNSSWAKVTVTSMVMAMEKPVNHSGDHTTELDICPEKPSHLTEPGTDLWGKGSDEELLMTFPRKITTISPSPINTRGLLNGELAPATTGLALSSSDRRIASSA